MLIILGPRFSRQCNAISWNPVNYNLLACGWDKHRSDNCIQIWDVEKSPMVNPELSPSKPFFEYGMGEFVHSLAWFNSSPHVLAVSCNSKSIRCIDIRGIFMMNISVADPEQDFEEGKIP